MGITAQHQELAGTQILPMSVRVFIENDFDQVCMVNELGKKHDTIDVPEGTPEYRKLPGWNLPGGKVEGTQEEILCGIKNQMSRQGMDHLLLNGVRGRRGILPVPKKFADIAEVYLTAVKETLEETGILILPTRIGVWPSSRREVVWLATGRRLTSGRRGEGLDVQIKETAWFPSDKIPERSYKRARAMVRRVTRPEKGARHGRA